MPQKEIYHRRKDEQQEGVRVQNPQIDWATGAFVVEKQRKNRGQQQTQVETAQQKQVKAVENKE
jgi:predicted protein tyrosine phosphatase